MITVTHHEQQAVFFQFIEPLDHGPAVGNEFPGGMAATHVQIGVVQRFKFFVFERPDDGILRIVVQEHDVRELDARPLADFQPRRDALQDRRLGGADSRIALFFVGVHFKIDRENDAAAHGRYGRFAFDKNKTARQFAENAFAAVFIHRFAHGGDACGAIAGKIDLRQRKPQRRRLAADKFFQFVPVLLIGSVLIAGDHRPGIQIDRRYGKQYFRYGYAFVFHILLRLLCSVIDHDENDDRQHERQNFDGNVVDKYAGYFAPETFFSHACFLPASAPRSFQ